jgi:antitoxin Phd
MDMSDNAVSFDEAEQNFSKVASMADQNGHAVIFKNNAPRYVLVEFAKYEKERLAGNDELLEISGRLIDRNRKAYEVLAK